MVHLQHLFFGLAVGFLGVLPPGLLNMTAARISVEQGRKGAKLFALGACMIICIQVYLGVFFSKLISSSPEIVTALEQLAIFVFIGLSIFFFIKARMDEGPDVRPVKHKGRRLFASGLMLSALNIFPVPFYIGFSTFLASRGLFVFRFPEAYLFILGAVAGSYVMLYIYLRYVELFDFNSATFNKKISYILSALTMAIAIFTVIKIYFPANA